VRGNQTRRRRTRQKGSAGEGFEPGRNSSRPLKELFGGSFSVDGKTFGLSSKFKGQVPGEWALDLLNFEPPSLPSRYRLIELEKGLS
jgi:hypothetical protein